MVIDPGGVHWRHDDPVAPGDPDRIIVAFTKWDEPIGRELRAVTRTVAQEFGRRWSRDSRRWRR